MELQGRYAQGMYYILLLLAFGSNFAPAITATAIVIGALLVLVHRIREQAWPVIDKPLGRVFGAYFLLWLAIALFSAEPWHSVKDVFATFYRIFPLFFVMMGLQNRRQLKGVLIAFAVSVAVTEAVAAWQLLGLGIHRPKGMSNNTIFLADHMIMAIPVLWWGANRAGSSLIWKTIFGGLCIFSIIVLFATETRGAWIAFFAMGFIYLALAKGARKKIMKGFSIIILACIVAGISSPYLQQRIVTISDMRYQSNSERLYMWRAASEMVRDYPLTGVGPDEFAVAYNSQYILPQAKERPANVNDPRSGHTHPHNNVFKRFAEGGLLGGVAFLALNAYLLFRLLKLYSQQKKAETCSFALMGILIFAGIHFEGMTDTSIIQVPVMREFWFVMGMALTVDRIAGDSILHSREG